uniref:Anoctamin n=1 Tax=Rhodnius prolixus TaxID=13249 RepID=T1HEM8_RHOPR
MDNTNRKSEKDIFPQTYIVVEFGCDIKTETAQWLVDKISKKRKDGGAELLVRRQPATFGQNLTVHVSANIDKLLELAEELEVRKRDKNGILREFTVDEIDEFINNERDELLTTADRQVLVKHELENIRALSHEMCILGHMECPLYEGQSIMSACLHYGIVKQIYPLHDDELIKKLGHTWYMQFFQCPPFEDIRIYFGESIALYFQFLTFYTISLVAPTVLGFLQMFLYPGTLAFFCILNIICATLFLELWRRKCSELAFIWGTITMTSFDEPRPNFRGTMGKDAVTGKLLPQAPRFKTHLKMYCVSLPVVVVCMFGAFLVMLFAFWVEDHLRQIPNIPLWVIYIPSIVYAVLIYIMNLFYRRFATFLTEWENHRTQSQFDRHRVTKMVLFEFVNNFMSLFYIAFVIQDMDLLRYQLATLLIVLQALNNVQEAILPLLLRHYYLKVNIVVSNRRFQIRYEPTRIDKDRRGSIAKLKQYGRLVELVGVKELDPDDSRIAQAVSEGSLEKYEDPYDDYLELFVQFGYVFLFSAVYPMAAFWAFFNNFLELRSDAFKLCCICQRPMSRKVKDTGAWQRAFQALCALSVMTNCALLCLSPPLRSVAPELSPVAWVMCFVFLEHLLMGLRQVLHYAIPDKPEWVRVALAKGNYQSKQALK